MGRRVSFLLIPTCATGVEADSYIVPSFYASFIALSTYDAYVLRTSPLVDTTAILRVRSMSRQLKRGKDIRGETGGGETRWRRASSRPHTLRKGAGPKMGRRKMQIRKEQRRGGRLDDQKKWKNGKAETATVSMRIYTVSRDKLRIENSFLHFLNNPIPYWFSLFLTSHPFK